MHRPAQGLEERHERGDVVGFEGCGHGRPACIPGADTRQHDVELGETFQCHGDGGFCSQARGDRGIADEQRRMQQKRLATADLAEPADQFGSSLASGSFDDDAFADLAVGVPNEAFDGISSAGVVQVFYGSAAGPGVLPTWRLVGPAPASSPAV